jgi:PAS domain S-box-containing protein
MEPVHEFVANTADGAVAVDRQQTITVWNRAACSILGRRAEDVVGRKCFEVLQGRDAKGCEVCRAGCEMFQAASRLSAPPTRDLTMRRSDGVDLWLSISTIVVPSSLHGLSVLVHLFRETTQHHEFLHAVRELALLIPGVLRSVEEPDLSSDHADAVCIELTRREREILAHLAAGQSTEAIAEGLFLSTRTVRNHVTNILAKLRVHSRLEAATFAIRNGLV